jgi:tetratricopeptide (TPR) repeat protein
VIVEDRRRRIQNVRNLLQNGEKIKSAKNYRAGGAALVLALEEAALLEESVVHWTPGPTTKVISRPREGWPYRLEEHDDVSSDERISTLESRKDAAAGQLSNRTTDNSKSDGSRVALPATYIPPFRHQAFSSKLPSSRNTQRNDAIKLYAFPSTEEIVTYVGECAASQDYRQLKQVEQLILEAIRVQNSSSKLPDRALRTAAAVLSRTYQELGFFNDAAELLRQVINYGQLDEEEYYEYKPLDLIHGLLGQLSITTSESNPGGQIQVLDLAAFLFSPTFMEKPKFTDERAFDIGKRLLELCFEANRLRVVDHLHRQCLVHHPDDFAFTQWYMSRLQEKNEHAAAIRCFVLHYSNMSPDATSLQAVGDMVVTSVSTTRNLDPAKVLNALLRLQGQSGMLKTTWVINLLSEHWDRHQDFDATDHLFQELLLLDLDKLVTHPHGVYRIMIEISFKAGKSEVARSYLDKLISKRPRFASDVRILGLFAKEKARHGDWAGVKMHFEAMTVNSKQNVAALGKVFVPILKIFARSHTISETEEFLRSYVETFEVPITPYVVTLMANEYGAVRDFQSLIQWFDYCTGFGFQAGAAFSNAILTNCRRRWRLPFKDLRTMFQKLRAISPGFTDKYTEQMMMDSALSECKQGRRRAAVGRVLSLGLNPDWMAGRGNSASEREVVLAMKRALATGQPGQCLRLYKRAVHSGMAFSIDALRLAIQASLQSRTNDYDAAYNLLSRAQRSGEDVSSAVLPILSAQIHQIDRKLDKDSRSKAINMLLRGIEVRNLTLSGVVLNRAAFACLNSGDSSGAITLALKAAEVEGRSQPCYNMYNFSVLLLAWAEIGEVDELHRLLSKAREQQYWTELHCLKALKQARKRLDSTRTQREAKQHPEALHLVASAVDNVVRAREKLRTEQRTLQREMLKIMRRSAHDSSTAPVDVARQAASEGWIGQSKGLKLGEMPPQIKSGSLVSGIHVGHRDRLGQVNPALEATVGY